MKSREHEIQAACIRWFDLQYPLYRRRLFAIPNGGQRSITTAARLKAEGVRAGVWDLFLAVPDFSHELGGLFIEMKAGKNKLTDEQQFFQQDLRGLYAFAVCYSLDEFIATINGYLK